MAGLHDIWPIRSKLRVTRAVFAPSLAAADAASQPACPPPITMTSKASSKTIVVSSEILLSDAESGEDITQNLIRSSLAGDFSKIPQGVVKANHYQFLRCLRAHELL